MNNNFAWTITDEQGNLLAYQEKGAESKVQVIDEDKARARCKALVEEHMDNTTLDYMTQMKAIGSVIFVWRRLLDLEDGIKSQKSNIILPGDKNFGIIQ